MTFEPWIHGAPGEPPLQAQRVDDATWVLRQGKAVDYEAPFLYLLLGISKALLLDTGATVEAPLLRQTVDDIIGSRELVVAHSHEHGDHIAGDPQFAGLVTSLGDTLDLGDRVLEVLRIPGHDATSIAIFDPVTGWLLTGDTVYPGRLYVDDAPAWIASIALLDDFARSHDVTALMGCHIEMTNQSGVDYPTGTLFQPDEPALPMTPAQLSRLRSVSHVALEPGRHVFDDFVIVAGQ
ncbi:MBL fold metallo-hydrolase [Glaciihabitans arcticus]|uniref:MBL fold metallo-hydrolase n=1 Tax=Glaciihabitans arcticus TaxID=2668039 RepID=A0A4Q9GZW9_9MICO|nr:MBL fold metallo-hydrolase [Glaciihabitans arcticus]TBN58393.1 MBL fold metallo-hydrolase [Glaciihabitans arcticus]